MFVHNFIWCIYDFWRGAVDGSQWSHTARGKETRVPSSAAMCVSWREERDGVPCADPAGGQK